MSSKQHGYALLVGMLALLGGATLFLNTLNSAFSPASHPSAAYHQATTLAKEARQALIGYAASYKKQPGALPCPDGAGNGQSTSCNVNASPRITGCIPWKTLGLESGLDESGAPMLYTLSTGWRNSIALTQRTPWDDTSSASYTARPINPGNAGTIDLHSPTESNRVAVAAIISAGLPVATQDRTSVSKAEICAGIHLKQLLESASDAAKTTIDNADNNGALIAAPTSDSFNDRIYPIYREDIFRPLLAPILALFSSDGSSDSGLPYYFSVLPPKTPDVLMLNAGNDQDYPQKAPTIMDRLADTARLDSAVIPPSGPSLSHTILNANKNSGSPMYCLNDNDNQPATWLCYNNWYRYIEYVADTTSATLTLSLDRTRTDSWKCKLTTTTTSTDTPRCVTN